MSKWHYIKTLKYLYLYNVISKSLAIFSYKYDVNIYYVNNRMQNERYLEVEQGILNFMSFDLIIYLLINEWGSE